MNGPNPAAPAPAARKRTVGDVMTCRVERCRSDEMLERCARIMWEQCCGAVPVVDEADRPVAMVTDRDVAMAAYLQGKPLEAIRVDSVMSEVVYTAYVGQSISSAEAIMRRHGVRRLPVVDDTRRLVGVLSVDDIARHLSENASTIDPLSPEAFAATFAALGPAR